MLSDIMNHYVDADLIDHPGIVPRLFAFICEVPFFRLDFLFSSLAFWTYTFLSFLQVTPNTSISGANPSLIASSVLRLAIPSLRSMCLVQELFLGPMGTKSLPIYAHELTLVHEWNRLCEALHIAPFTSTWRAPEPALSFLRTIEPTKLAPISTNPFKLYPLPQNFATLIEVAFRDFLHSLTILLI